MFGNTGLLYLKYRITVFQVLDYCDRSTGLLFLKYCYVMVCDVMLCYSMLCYAMLRYRMTGSAFQVMDVLY